MSQVIQDQSNDFKMDVDIDQSIHVIERLKKPNIVHFYLRS